MPTPAERVSELTAMLNVFNGTDAGRSVVAVSVTFVPDPGAPNGYRATIDGQAKTGAGVVVEETPVTVNTPAGWRAQLDSVFAQAVGAWKTARGVP